MTPLFSAEALLALQTPGVAERWAAVQAQLHPLMVRLAEQIAAGAAQQLPRQWPLYELSFKSQRYLNRGQGRREPISDYWLAFDRPPRGAGVLVAVSGAEQAILVGLQLWGSRKADLATLWAEARPVWHPLVAQIGQVGQARFSAARQSDPPEAAAWIEQYLASGRAGYLWAGFVYPWATQPADLAERICADVLALLPLNEALMEQVEAREPRAAALLRERPSAYAPLGLPTIEQISERMCARGFTISELNLRAYHVALQTRPLAILAGISGTGKTRLTRLYADAVYDLAPGQTNPYYLSVAVQPDWHNARDLLGYYNALTGQYHATAFLRILLQAAADPQQPYYVCLDELNLARPEYYLAPILSAMETSDGLLDLGLPTAEASLVGGGVVRSPIRLPLNLRMIGTVNVDESSFALSDKLLDRVNLIELTEVDLAGFRASYPGAIDDSVWATLIVAHQTMTAAGQPFGYRTLGAILTYLEQAQTTLPTHQALDLQLKQTLLPKLRGEDHPRLRRALNELLALTLGLAAGSWGRAAQITLAQLAAAPYPQSAAKLQQMLQRLDQDGFTDFYG
ncbi:MAG: McrB family protein [Oscillochloridaceae bacterium umkhey_bin13]